MTAEDLAAEPVIVQESDAPQEDEELRVIIIFQDASLLEKGYSTAGLATIRRLWPIAPAWKCARTQPWPQ